jgi:hypothetical protein
LVGTPLAHQKLSSRHYLMTVLFRSAEALVEERL